MAEQSHYHMVLLMQMTQPYFVLGLTNALSKCIGISSEVFIINVNSIQIIHSYHLSYWFNSVCNPRVNWCRFEVYILSLYGISPKTESYFDIEWLALVEETLEGVRFFVSQ